MILEDILHMYAQLFVCFTAGRLMHQRYQHFVRTQRKMQKQHCVNDGIYMVKSDIHACFDNMKQELLIDIVDEIMKRINVK